MREWLFNEMIWDEILYVIDRKVIIPRNTSIVHVWFYSYLFMDRFTSNKTMSNFLP